MTANKLLLPLITTIILWISGLNDLTAEELKSDYPKMAVVLYGDQFGNEDLVITAPYPHRYEFGIKTPNGDLLLIYSILYDDIPMNNPNEFVGFWETTTLPLNTITLKGVYYDDGRPITVNVFTEPGLYCLHFSSNFETHPEDTDYSIMDIQWPSPSDIQHGVSNGKCLDEFLK